LIVILLITTKI